MADGGPPEAGPRQDGCTTTAAEDSPSCPPDSSRGSVPRGVFGDITNLMGRICQLSFSASSSRRVQTSARILPDLGGEARRISHRLSEPGAACAPSSAPKAILSRSQSAGQTSAPQCHVAHPSPEDAASPDIRFALKRSEYASDIQSFYHQMESSCMASNYMASQPSITPWMRSVLVDFLVKVHLAFQLRPEVIYLAVNVTDCFLEKVPIMRKELQLVGVSALFIAAKYEGLEGPCSAQMLLSDLVYVCDGAYSWRQIVRMERAILNVLKFNIAVPTHHQFIACYTEAAGLQSDRKFSHLCHYIAQLSLLEYDLLEHSYSEISAAAVHLALEITGLLGASTWPASCEEQSCHTREDLQPAVAKLYSCLSRGGLDCELTSIHKKYCKPDFGMVASCRAIRRLQASLQS